eukprot:3710393-Amphidinium_carterae.4
MRRQTHRGGLIEIDGQIFLVASARPCKLSQNCEGASPCVRPSRDASASSRKGAQQHASRCTCCKYVGARAIQPDATRRVNGLL